MSFAHHLSHYLGLVEYLFFSFIKRDRNYSDWSNDEYFKMIAGHQLLNMNIPLLSIKER